MRLFIAFLSALLFVACGGSAAPTVSPTDSASPILTPTRQPPVFTPLTPPPTDVPIVTPAPTDSAGRPICSFEHLSAKVTSQEGAAAHTFIFVGISNTGPDDCDLPGPPLAMLLQDSTGMSLNIDHDTNNCDAATTDDCVQAGPVTLRADVPTPVAPMAISGQAQLVVTIATIELFAPCPSPNVNARYLGLLFLGVGGPFLEALLSAPVELQKCVPSVTLHSFGPAT